MTQQDDVLDLTELFALGEEMEDVKEVLLSHSVVLSQILRALAAHNINITGVKLPTVQ